MRRIYLKSQSCSEGIQGVTIRLRMGVISGFLTVCAESWRLAWAVRSAPRLRGPTTFLPGGQNFAGVVSTKHQETSVCRQRFHRRITTRRS